jgi:hypothetical protein
MEPVDEGVIDRYLADLRAAADEVRSGDVATAAGAEAVYAQD